MTKISFSKPRRIAIKLGAGVLALGLMGAAAAEAAETYRFGLAMPLSGRSALYGQDQVKAATWAVAEINKAGGINGKKLEMVVLDTQANPQVGIQAVNKLISVEKVPVFVTAWSGVVKAIAPVANDNKVLALSVGANSPDIANLGDYVYTTFPLADVDVTALAKYSATDFGKKRAAVMYINNDTGVVAAKVYKAAFTKAGGDVVAYEAYEPKASDFTGAILKIRSSNPDIVHVHGLVAEIPQIIAQMRQLGINTPISSYSAAYNPKLIKVLGPAAEGVMATSLAPGVKQSAAVGAYVERWKSEEGRAPNGLPYTQYLYDAPYMIAAIFTEMDKQGIAPTGENVRAMMLKMRTFQLKLTGSVTIFDNHTVNKPVYIMEVKNGKWVEKAVVNK